MERNDNTHSATKSRIPYIRFTQYVFTYTFTFLNHRQDFFGLSKQYDGCVIRSRNFSLGFTLVRFFFFLFSCVHFAHLFRFQCCVFFFCLSSYCVTRNRCCQCLWIVIYGLLRRFSLTFI